MWRCRVAKRTYEEILDLQPKTRRELKLVQLIIETRLNALTKELIAEDAKWADIKKQLAHFDKIDAQMKSAKEELDKLNDK
jgi:hypothetical protein